MRDAGATGGPSWVDGGIHDAGAADASTLIDGGLPDGYTFPTCTFFDAGQAPFSFADGDGGLWTLPAFTDCNLRCDGGGTLARGESGCEALAACSCGTSGSTDFTAGCTTDSDCELVQADCCGCAAAGSMTSILKANDIAWMNQIFAYCYSDCAFVLAECFEETICVPDAGAACVAGHCRYDDNSSFCIDSSCGCIGLGDPCGEGGSLSCCSGYCGGDNLCSNNPNYDAGCYPTTCPAGQPCSACELDGGGGSYECAGAGNSGWGRCCIPGSSWERCGSTGDPENNGCCLAPDGTQLACTNVNGANVCCNECGGSCATSADCCPNSICDGDQCH